MIKNFILFAALALILCSCENDGLDITIHRKATADIRAILDNVYNDNHIEVAVAGENSMVLKHRGGMSVSLHVNGLPVCSGLTDDWGYFSLDNCHFNPGDKVELFVDNDTLDIHASAQCVVDQPVVIKDFNKVLDDNSRPLYYITINDPINDGKEHFYRIFMYNSSTYFWPDDYYFDGERIDSVSWVKNIYRTSSKVFYFENDMALNDGQSRVNMVLGDEIIKTYGTWMGGTDNLYAIFSNKYFENGQYTLCVDPSLQSVNYSIWSQGWDHILVCVSRISEDEYYFLHASSLLAQYDGGQLFSGNPPSLHSNINGAKGIFAVESTSAVYDFWSHVGVEEVQQTFNADSIAADKETFLQHFNL